MDDALQANLQISSLLKPKITQVEDAIEIAKTYLSEISPDAGWKKTEPFRIGKAVLIYYPFWQFTREDGSKIRKIHRPAFGTLMTDIQELEGLTEEEIPETPDMKILSPTLNAEYYYPTVYGIPRGEKIVGIPFWLVSYKMEKSIYMLKINATNGEIVPEWHPVKETVNWLKIILLSFIPVMILSTFAILLHPAIFILVGVYIIYLIYSSNMLSLLNKKRRAEEEGEENGA